MTFANHLARTAISAAVVATSVAVAAPATRSAAAPAFCAQQATYPGTTITWTGGASGAHQHDWNDPDNWDPATVPDAAQDGSTYQAEYVCIGGGASVQIASNDSYHVAGLDIGQGAQLVVAAKGGVFLGADSTADLVPSVVEKGGDLTLDAATLGGNATISIAGTLDWTAKLQGKHRLPATQSGSGTTVVTSSGRLLVDGPKFGAAVLAGSRHIENSGTLTISKAGFVSMADGTALIDRAGSRLALRAGGGIYPNQPDAAASVKLKGAVTKSGAGLSVIGIPTTLGKHTKPAVAGGGLSFAVTAVPKVKLPRGTSYGIGSCDATDRTPCHAAAATKPVPQAAVVGTSTEAPKRSAVKVALRGGPSKLKGHKVIGRSVAVTAPTERTTHSTHLTFDFDASMHGVGKAGQPVFRNQHQITVCRVQGLTALNTSCVLSEKIVRGDLEVIVISIQPNATWAVA